MAEVRLRFGRRAYKFIKHSYPSLLDKECKPVLKAAYVTALIHSAQLCESDRVVVDERVDNACRVCLQTPKGNSYDPTARIFTCFRSAGGYAGSLKAPLDLLTENVSGNIWTDCIGLETKDVIPPVYGSSCLETHEKRLFLCTQCHFKSQLRRSICTKTLYGLPPARLRQFTSELVSFRAYSRKQNNGSPGEPLYKSKSAYYDILEVSPTATHAQIKTAYYKQSFVYHPDRNAGSEDATFRFSQISEAYNVLGNKALRKKYDRGILSQADLHGRPTGSDSTVSSGQQTRARHSPSVGADQQNIFDFDAFIRAHYGEQLQREKELRQRREKILRKQQQHYEDVKLGRMKEVAVGILLVMAMAIVLSLRSSK